MRDRQPSPPAGAGPELPGTLPTPGFRVHTARTPRKLRTRLVLEPGAFGVHSTTLRRLRPGHGGRTRNADRPPGGDDVKRMAVLAAAVMAAVAVVPIAGSSGDGSTAASAATLSPVAVENQK